MATTGSPKLDGLFAKQPARDEFLKYCVYTTQIDPVFIWLVQEYKANSSKKKAIQLYETFCVTGASPLELNADSKTLAPGNKGLVATIDELKKLKAAADEMNFFKRVMTSKERKPPLEAFDDIVAHLIKGNPRTGNSISEPVDKFDKAKKALQQADFQGGKLSSAQSSYVTKSWEPERKKLEAAGFAVKSLK